jgi:hypothetical protein
MDSSIINIDPTSANASGFKAVNDSSNYIELVMPGSTNSLANVGQLTSPLSFTLNTTAASKTITISTNNTSRMTITDSGVNINSGTINNTTIGSSTPAAATVTTLDSTSTTQSTSTSTGAIVTSGGLGVAKNVYIGGTLNVNGGFNFPSNTLTLNLNFSAGGTVYGVSTGVVPTLNYTQIGNVYLCQFFHSFTYTSATASTNFFYTGFPNTSVQSPMSGVCDNQLSNFTGATEPYTMGIANSANFPGVGSIPINSFCFYTYNGTLLAFQIIGGTCYLSVNFIAYV